MTQPETWALADSQFTSLPWSPAFAAKSFDASKLPSLIAHHAAALEPVAKDWLADRLRVLWKSSVVNGSLDATAWLHETGRLLSDLPRDIVGDAIDHAVKSSARGFMPTVGEIRAIAEPRFSARQRHAARLRAIDGFNRNPPSSPEPEVKPVESRHAESTADILKRAWPTMHKHAAGYADGPEKMNLDPARACRKPSREDYIRMGVDPDVLDRIEEEASAQ